MTDQLLFSDPTKANWRKTSQTLAPPSSPPTVAGQYDIYPAFSMDPERIARGFDTLAARLLDQSTVVIDGYGGVFWNDFRSRLDSALKQLGISASWTNVDDALLQEAAIDEITAPFLGGDDPLFGTRFTGSLIDFFDKDKLRSLRPIPGAQVNIIYGCGASLAGWDGCLIYVDVPKNEIQFRSRAASVTNLGKKRSDNPKVMYKRFYFVDWPALNGVKAALLPKIDIVVDAQRPDDITHCEGDDLRKSLSSMSRSYFRVRPWFEPGPWGGQWIKEHVPQLPSDPPNYAWSFELIVPENGLTFESSGVFLELSFDFLMYHDHKAVLGETSDRFGYDFPIRFDFLDTFEGGNLSVQCHPSPEFTRTNFGESFTQDETYYILDCVPDAEVYLGFNEDIDPQTFRDALERSFLESVPVDINRFVNREPAHKHDLFLIPHGTIHCSGIGSLVLEISATPYIFTFKMYDWLRLDLEGRPRPLNIERAFQNLHFERKGERVKQELVSKPAVIAKGDNWQLIHVPTHRKHFYDVHRVEFSGEVELTTDGSCQVMSLVEGRTVILESGGLRQQFNYAETFVVPAAAEKFKLIAGEDGPVKVVKAFMKRPV
jgi:mannose-6-phosphate isomerase class I